MVPPRIRPQSIDPWLFFGLVAFFALVVAALFGERVAPNEPIYFVVEHGRDPRPYEPGIVFPFGSDVLGRDLFSLVLTGARATLTIVLIAGLARVVAGVLVAAVGSWSRPTRLFTETIADFVASIPATLVAVLLVKAFVGSTTSIPILIGALLLVGWAGPYRVIRAEVDRLTRAPFSEGARATGVTRRRLFWRHQVPHLLPVIAMNLSQQVVASLVLVAELGVVGVLVGPVRSLSVEESLSVVRIGPPNAALIPDITEWGVMLSSARTTEILWATRWVIFVPGAAFALTAMSVALIGFALARRYARRDVFNDLRAGSVVGVAVLALFLVSGLIPERYAEAREWAASARSAMRSEPDPEAAFADAGLTVHSVERRTRTIVRTGPATLTVGRVTVEELFPQPGVLARDFDSNTNPSPIHVRSIVSEGLGGGGVVEAPLVFGARGIAPASIPQPRVFGPVRQPSLATLVKDYPDDYASIDVRGKIVLLVRFMGVDAGPRGLVEGFSVGTSVGDAIKRGAVGVIIVDRFVGAPGSSLDPRSLLALNAYVALEELSPPIGVSGVPVMVVDPDAARRLVGSVGSDIDQLVGYDAPGKTWDRSFSLDVGLTARIAVPLREDVSAVATTVAEVPGFSAETGRVVIWADHRLATTPSETNRRDVLASLARFAAARHAPFIFVDFDLRADALPVREFLASRRVLVVIILDQLEGSVLYFTTANGDLIPAFDLYAEKAGTRHETTRRTYSVDQVGSPVPDLKTVVIGSSGTGTDARADATALVGYLAGRLALGAPELGR
jgi:ABC-type dipeptide/oligopeptide/nickel transport system permease subunit